MISHSLHCQSTELVAYYPALFIKNSCSFYNWCSPKTVTETCGKLSAMLGHPSMGWPGASPCTPVSLQFVSSPLDCEEECIQSMAASKVHKQ